MLGLRFLTRLVHRSLTLPENLNLPCVSIFAVCFLSGTRQRATLPCATTKTPGLKKTHGKFMLCRVLFLAHGKTMLCCVPFFWHTAKSIVYRVSKISTRQSMDLPYFFAHDKIIFFSFLNSKLF